MLGSLFFFRIQSPIIGFCSPLSIHRFINSAKRMLCLFIYPFRPKSTALFATDGYGGWILRCEHLWRTEQPLEFRHRRNERGLDMGVPLHDRSACAHRGHRCIHALLRVEACSRCFRLGSCLCCALSCLLLSESTFLFLPSFLPSVSHDHLCARIDDDKQGIGKVYGDWLHRNAKAVQASLAVANTAALEALSCIRTVFLHGTEQAEVLRYGAVIREYFVLNVKQTAMQAG